jgi:hypothetical protein
MTYRLAKLGEVKLMRNNRVKSESLLSELFVLIVSFFLLFTLSRTFFLWNLGVFLTLRLALSDLVMSFLPALSLVLIPWRSVRWIALVFWCLVIAGNIQHIHENSGNASLLLIGYAFSKDFLLGSVLTILMFLKTALHFTLFQLSYLFLTLLSCRFRGLRNHFFGYSCIIGFSVLFVILFSYPLSERAPVWGQMNPLEENMRAMYRIATLTPQYFNKERLPFALRPYYEKDLSGTKLEARSPGKSPNILVLIVESLNSEIVQAGWMPNLGSLYSQGISFEQYVVNSTTTNNGLYAMFCGDFPQVFFSSFSVIALSMADKNSSSRWSCLPRILRENGYRTVFVQAAGLNYAHKDTLLAQAGFSQMFGSDSFDDRDRVAWGLGASDKALFHQALLKIRELERERSPWFVSVLNVATHPPGFVAEEDFPNVSNQIERAYRVTDREISTLLAKLRNESILDNTLVIITTDESRQQDSLRGKYSSVYSTNNGFLLILTPGKSVHKSSNPYLQSDMKLSVLDFLDLGTEEAFGRSFFRAYSEKSRKYFFGFNHTGKLYISLGDKQILHCNSSFECVNHQLDDWNIFHQRYLPALPLNKYEIAEKLIAYSDSRILH